MKRFPSALAFEESVSQALSARARSLLLVGLCLALGAGITWFSSTELQRISTAHQDDIATGHYLLEVGREDKSPLPAEICDSLNQYAQVEAAGGVLTTSPARFSSGGNAEGSLVLATPAYPQIAWPELAGRPVGTVVAGSYLSQTLGLVPGAWVSTNSTGPLQVDTITSSPPRVKGRETALVMVGAPHGQVSRCLVLAKPGQLQAARDLAEFAFFPGASTSQVYPGTDIDRDAQLRERLSQFGPPAAAGMILLVLVLIWLSRTWEVALYRLLGMRGVKLAVFVVVDYLLVVLAPFAAGAGLALAWSHPTVQPALLLVGLDLLRAATLLLCWPVVGIGILGSRNPIGLLKRQ